MTRKYAVLQIPFSADLVEFKLGSLIIGDGWFKEPIIPSKRLRKGTYWRWLKRIKDDEMGEYLRRFDPVLVSGEMVEWKLKLKRMEKIVLGCFDIQE